MELERSDYLRQQYDCYSSHVVQACDHKSWKLIRSYKLMKYGSQHKIIGGILVEKEMIIVLDFGGQYNQLTYIVRFILTPCRWKKSKR